MGVFCAGPRDARNFVKGAKGRQKAALLRSEDAYRERRAKADAECKAMVMEAMRQFQADAAKEEP